MNHCAKRAVARLRVVFATLAIGLCVPAPAGAIVADENALRCGDRAAVGAAWFIYDPGRCQTISHERFLQQPLIGFYRDPSRGTGFDQNFMVWAPIAQIDPGGRYWASCESPHPAGTICGGGIHYDPVRSDVAAGPITVKVWGDGWISVVCGNHSLGGNRTGPIPRIVGTKYLDRNANGVRDAGEPGLAGWRMQLRYNGQPIEERVTASDGRYEFALDTNRLPISGGTYEVREIPQEGYRQTQGPAPVHVPLGVGAQVYTMDFGNYRIPRLTVDDVRVDEGDPAGFRLRLDEAVGRPVSVELRTADGTARAGDDYGARAPSRFEIPAGATTATVDVATVADALDEDDETFDLLLRDGVDVAIADDRGTATIVDDDAPPRVSIGDTTFDPEGDPPARTARAFGVTLDAPSGRAIQVAWRTAGRTATASADFEPASGVVSIAPGETSGEASVDAIGDELDEPDEMLAVELSDPVDAEIADGEGIGTIVDDDAPPSISIRDGRAVEGDPVEFDVELSAPSAFDVRARFTTADDTAVAPDDYAAADPPRELVVPAGQTRVSVSVETVEDALNEDDEHFRGLLRELEHADPGDLAAVGTIVDDERAGRFLCRASAVRLGGAEPFVANPGGRPCRADTAGAARIDQPLGAQLRLTALAAEAVTEQSPPDLDAADPAVGDHGTAAAGAAQATLVIGGSTVLVTGAEANARAECVVVGAEQPRLTGDARLATLHVNGVQLRPGAGPQEIALGGLTIHLNEVTVGERELVARAVRLEGPAGSGVEVVLGEARAGFDGSPCAREPLEGTGE
jgi:hypothetical protein